MSLFKIEPNPRADLWAWRNRPRRPQAKATRGKRDVWSAGMVRMSNGSVVAGRNYDRRDARIGRAMAAWFTKRHAKAKLNRQRSLAGMSHVLKGGAQ